MLVAGTDGTRPKDFKMEVIDMEISRIEEAITNLDIKKIIIYQDR